ncbi:MAG TPA: hypothetical protein VG713_10960 [Pirellulales bacterium]|nr:hypothetical protein [Pirellulales bacterium]
MTNGVMYSLTQSLMDEFAHRTGIEGMAKPRRYLWTDAFAVCNYLALFRKTHDGDYLRLASALVDQVHHVLGRHRTDDARRGWISGLSDEAGDLHPTRGGLRIGKALPERGPHEPYDARAEWDRDGQYFHYLTKWMHALHRMACETGDEKYQRWAIELASTASAAFTVPSRAGDGPRMVWKMSIDLKRPLVSSMGQHDPLDGLITLLELQSGSGMKTASEINLARPINEMASMCLELGGITDDPLGIGGLLDCATRLAELTFEHGVAGQRLLLRIVADAEASLHSLDDDSLFAGDAEHRLAFRELGLAIGLHGLATIHRLTQHERQFEPAINELQRYLPLAGLIEAFWSDPANRRNRTWSEHADINNVMLATSLMPAGYLAI